METGELILIGLVVGGGAYLLLRKPAAPAAPVKPPCAIAYNGISVPCAAVGDAIKTVGTIASGAASILTSGFGMNGNNSLSAAIADANARGIVYTPPTDGWRGGINTPTAQKLPAGYLNYITPDGKSVYQAPASSNGKWIGTAVQPRVTA
jgi:hypothetical protein